MEENLETARGDAVKLNPIYGFSADNGTKYVDLFGKDMHTVNFSEIGREKKVAYVIQGTINCPKRQADVSELFENRFLKTAKSLQGFDQGFKLVDPHSGKTFAITVWKDERSFKKACTNTDFLVDLIDLSKTIGTTPHMYEVSDASAQT